MRPNVLGAWIDGDGVRFHVWAPVATSVSVLVEQAGSFRLARSADGTWIGFVPKLKAGARYRYQVDDQGAFPDPCSRFQPDGVHGPSEVIDPSSFAWTDAGWKGIGLDELIVYELHVGTFSEAGTFAGVIEHLPALVELGVTALELMPVADFPGKRNWGYDGVDLFASARCYGRPDDLRRLVDEAHRLGLAVLLDVVYNHLGPDGNYLAVYSPYYFSQRHHTHWGQALNFDGEHSEPVRAFFIANALHWIHEYHIDGLRLDATHAILDDSPRPFFAELAEKVHASVTGRQVLVVAEDHRNLAVLFKPAGEGGWNLDAVWADDFHHEMRRLLAGDHEGYFRDYQGTPADVATTLRQGWFFCGQHSEHFGGPRGSDPQGLPPRTFVHCLQNHDQIGNRALGERLHQQIDAAAFRAATVLLLCSPCTPLLFMGQEWAASTPFLFFTDHNAELGPKVTEGRRREFRHFAAFADPQAQAKIPDCQAESTFLASRLNWQERVQLPHAAMLRLHAELLRLRRTLPALRSSRSEDFEVAATEGGIVLLRRPGDSGTRVVIVVQLQGGGAVDLLGHPLLATTAHHRWEPILTTEDPAFAVDSRQPRIDLVENGVTLHFHRPGAVIFKEIAVPAVAGSAAPILESPFADDEAFRRYLRDQRRLPLATYRLQLQPAFTFRDAAAIIPYLAELGISDVYCSSYLKAAPGSTHGYDICDYGTLNPELGSDADYQAFLDELSAHGMGHVLDFVPNHMAVEPVQNLWWHDMLEHGPASPFARFFDVDWDPEKPELKNRVLLPFLGDQYGAVLERGELKLVLEDGRLSVVSGGDTRRPIDPAQYPAVLGLHSESLQDKLAPTDPQHLEFLSILTALEHLPAVTETAPERSAVRLRESRLACKRLAELLAAAAAIRDHVEQNLRTLNGAPGKPASFDALHNLLEHQAFRLAYWKTAGHEINYRRFFDINQLAGLRMEEPAVFTATHALVLRLIGAGKITGLRLDHIDGLFDPAGYLEMLQAAIFEERAAAFLGLPFGGERLARTGAQKVHARARTFLMMWRRKRERQRDPGGIAERPLYVVAEKILSTDEDLLPNWPIHGSTGYDFLNDVNRLFVDARNATALKRVYARFSGRSAPLAELVYACKRTISGTSLASELNVLGQMLNRISEADRRTRDFTLFSLRQALREIAVCFSVYRTYVDESGATPTDAQLIDLAIRRARARNPAMESSVFDFIRAALVPDRTQLTADQYRARLRFAMKFQQYSGPLQAKGLEDTAFYQYNVLISLNEVGGDPQRFGGTLTQFHEANLRRLSTFPHGLLATATHDTKRGEDARARLNVLSEIPGGALKRHSVSRWARLNARHRTTIDGVPAPDRNDEYLFYQALLGVWPAEPMGTTHAAAPADFVERMRQFMQKAVKEAKEHTSWISPNEAYDRAVADFVAKSLTGTHGRRFLAEFLPLQQRVARLGLINSLAQLVLKIVSPGVPDFYQGNELWDWSLVDPDNRRPVDFAQRRPMLEDVAPLFSDGAVRTPALADMLENGHDGRIKLWLTVLGLRLRQRFAGVFQRGEYLPLEADGEHAEHVVAIGRRFEGSRIIAVVPRLLGQITPDPRSLPMGPGFWKATCLKLPPAFSGAYENGLTFERLPGDGTSRLPLSNILQGCPVAILHAEARR